MSPRRVIVISPRKSGTHLETNPAANPGRLSVASLNTRGVPIFSSRLVRRYAAIGAEFEAGRADVVCLQEVGTYWHLWLLARQLPSFRYVSYRPSVAGPAGALVTFSRRPVSGTVYRSFGTPPGLPGISWRNRLRARLRGALVTQLTHPGLSVVNTHLVSSRDGDWSRTSQFYPLHRVQLAALTRIVRGIGVPAVVCGDFNVARSSPLFSEFMAGSELGDAFEGRCQATFHAEYLPADAVPQCIDFILPTAGVKAESAGMLLAGKVMLPGGPGFASDHIGLYADLLLVPPPLPAGTSA